MWKRILVPHDFSACANHAAALARNEAKAHGGELLLLHVIDLPPALGAVVGDTSLAMVGAKSSAPMGIRDYAVLAATEHIRDLANRIEVDDVAVTTFVRIGHPVDEILRLAAEHEVDTIVMGTHGRSGLQQMLTGSVAERVVRTSPVPVLTTRHA